MIFSVVAMAVAVIADDKQNLLSCVREKKVVAPLFCFFDPKYKSNPSRTDVV